MVWFSLMMMNKVFLPIVWRDTMDKKIESAQGEQTNTSSNAHQEINHGITDQII